MFLVGFYENDLKTWSRWNGVPVRHNPPSLGVLGSFSCALLAPGRAFLFQLQLLISKLPDGSRFLRATVLSARGREIGQVAPGEEGCRERPAHACTFRLLL